MIFCTFAAQKQSMKIITGILFSFFITNLCAQSASDRLVGFQKDLETLKAKETNLLQQIEEVKLEIIRADLQQFGLPAVQPGEEVINHSAMSLVYSEQHEQAKWVAHIITPDFITGSLFRSNDFRPDPMVKTGTAVEEDYFLKELKADSTYRYDGFGYDRGHLAPSADFRWSAKAMSESYFYSNMSPQRGTFNRESWADVEGSMRSYLYRNRETQLYVCTGGVLTDDLPVIERGPNKVSIPAQFYKVIIDLKNEKGIAFLMSNRRLSEPLHTYTKSIDEIEKLTGIDFFTGLPDDLEAKIEAQNTAEDWLPVTAFGDVAAVPMSSLPKMHYNTDTAAKIMGKGALVTVVGKAVSARRSRNGNVLINLDKQFPNQTFTIFIKQEHVIDFPYDPEIELPGKMIYVTGEVESLSGKPVMFIERESAVVF